MGLPPGLQSAREVKAFYDQRYQAIIDSGDYSPFLYPWATMGTAVILLYLLIDHRRSPALKALRFPLFAFLCAFSTWSIVNHRARSAAGAYGVGLVQAWGTLWTGAIMCFDDCQTDFKRIQRADANDETVQHESRPVGSASSRDGGDLSTAHVPKAGPAGPSKRRLTWQSYPDGPLIERLDWIADAFCSFRGVGWSFETNGIPPAPDFVQVELHNDGGARPTTRQGECAPTVTVSRTGIRRFHDRNALLRDTAIRLALGALVLDAIKCLMHHDAYFWGYTDAPPPAWLSPYSEPHRTLGPVVAKSYRLLLSLFGIHFALHGIFRLGPIFFTAILGPTIVGLRGEAWMNPPDAFGDFSAVRDQGLAGWWGSFWHQMFRFAFEAPATRLLDFLAVERRSRAGKCLGVMVAFLLSGSLHACGSFTQLGDTAPIRGPFMFFQWQAVGVVGQMLLARQLKTLGISQEVPTSIRQATNLLVTIMWMYWTAPLLVDDFAKGGVWLYEPLAFSPLRALGFGAPDDRSCDLWHGLMFWHRGEHWWGTGLAF